MQTNLIAQGASAKVYRGKWKGKDIAIKRFEQNLISWDFDEFTNEIAMMSLVQVSHVTPVTSVKLTLSERESDTSVWSLYERVYSVYSQRTHGQRNSVRISHGMRSICRFRRTSQFLFRNMQRNGLSSFSQRDSQGSETTEYYGTVVNVMMR